MNRMRRFLLPAFQTMMSLSLPDASQETPCPSYTHSCSPLSFHFAHQALCLNQLADLAFVFKTLEKNKGLVNIQPKCNYAKRFFC